MKSGTKNTIKSEMNTKMKAAVYREYGTPDVFKLEEVKKPVPRDYEMVVKVHATTTTAADCMMRRGDTLMSRVIIGFWRPKPRYQVMGIELAGEVETVGSKVSRFCPGDRVFGFSGFSVGAYAQYNCLPQTASLATLPKSLTFDEAASIVDGATTAIYFLQDKAKLKADDNVLIIGASGSIGTAAVQLASHAGAEVTAVCSGRNTDMVKSLGADRVIDYTKSDFTKNDDRYDIIFDTVGKSTYFKSKKCLTTNGRYLMTVGGPKQYLLTLLTRVFTKKKCIFGISIEKNAALQQVQELVASKALRPVIDRRYSLDEIAEAHRYVDKGHKRGNVIITISHRDTPVDTEERHHGKGHTN